MADPAVRLTLGELADRFGLQVAGDPATRIEGIGTLAGDGHGRLEQRGDPRERGIGVGGQERGSRAGAGIVRANAA